MQASGTERSLGIAQRSVGSRYVREISNERSDRVARRPIDAAGAFASTSQPNSLSTSHPNSLKRFLLLLLLLLLLLVLACRNARGERRDDVGGERPPRRSRSLVPRGLPERLEVVA
jgi:hypothetical protein